MVSVPDVFRNITAKLESSASVNTVYGEPITSEGKTIIPVAKVRYGFGAGGGSGSSAVEGDDPTAAVEGSGGGGGGGVEVTPVGIIEITAGETRFIAFEERRRIVKMLVVGAVIALILILRRRKRK